MDKIDIKFNRLKKIIADAGSLAVAYSGGVDSNFLLKVSSDLLENNLIAVTATSESYPDSEHREALNEAKNLGVKHIVIESSELQIKDFSDNPPERCYYCKVELFKKILTVAEENNIDYAADGANYDDRGDFRPGIKAGDELGVLHPLMEAELTKAEIRELSKRKGLNTWDKPAYACLASRVPYGEKITAKKLTMIERAERYVKELGIKQVRVRHHGDMARIEVKERDIEKLLSENTRNNLVREFKEIGYLYVTVDIEGFRSGSMNEVLK
ncbi:MAG: ATP-dependent sacrificial sulfur transferase LarE [Elusimicrobia bacterium]|jgi:uncharacterized protein|nr:ATP-dependent sacrificial sulfur transferase LarE [Elusimicrobiota bacterium]